MQTSQKTQCPSCGASSVFKITTKEYKCNYCQINFYDSNTENIHVNNSNNNLVTPVSTQQQKIIIIALVVSLFLIGLGCAMYFIIGK